MDESERDEAEQDVLLFLEDVASAQKYAGDLATLFRALNVSHKRNNKAKGARGDGDEWQRRAQALERQLKQTVAELDVERCANRALAQKQQQMQVMLR